MFSSLILCIIGIALGFLSCFIFNILPEKWVCDYDQAPDKQLENPRVSILKWGAVCAAVLGFCGFVIGLRYQSVYAYLILAVVLFSLAVITISDIKYTIIPDQFVVLILICAVFVFLLFFFFKSFLFYDYIWSPLLGALIGGGGMIFISLVGRLLYKKDVMGFGDVKLFFACGLVLGANGAIFCLISTLVLAAIFFIINIALRRLSLVSMTPLGPFICIGTALFILFQREVFQIAHWYISLF